MLFLHISGYLQWHSFMYLGRFNHTCKCSFVVVVSWFFVVLDTSSHTTHPTAGILFSCVMESFFLVNVRLCFCLVVIYVGYVTYLHSYHVISDFDNNFIFSYFVYWWIPLGIFILVSGKIQSYMQTQIPKYFNIMDTSSIFLFYMIKPLNQKKKKYPTKCIQNVEVSKNIFRYKCIYTSLK